MLNNSYAGLGDYLTRLNNIIIFIELYWIVITRDPPTPPTPPTTAAAHLLDIISILPTPPATKNRVSADIALTHGINKSIIVI